jgi:hypothetical protein
MLGELSQSGCTSTRSRPAICEYYTMTKDERFASQEYMVTHIVRDRRRMALAIRVHQGPNSDVGGGW